MTTAVETPLIQDAPDGPGLLTQADDGKLLAWDWQRKRFTPATVRVTGGGTVLRSGASRIQDAPDGPGSLGSGDDGKALVWNNATGRFVLTAFEASGAVAAHAALTTTHGVSGAIVGTSDSQALTNKTYAGTTATLTSLVSTPVVKAPASDLVLWPSTGVVKFTNGSGVERGYYNAGDTTWDISPLPDSTAASAFRFFRFTNTSGAKSLAFYKGDNTATLIHQIGINAVTRFNNQSDDIDFNIRGDTDASLFFLDASVDNIGIGVGAPTAKLHVAASSTARASLCLPHGTAPTSPVNGDMWTTTAGLYVRINGVTVGPLS